MSQQELLKKVIQVLEDTGIEYMITGHGTTSGRESVNVYGRFSRSGACAAPEEATEDRETEEGEGELPT